MLNSEGWKEASIGHSTTWWDPIEKKSKKQMSVIVEVKEKMKAVTNEKVLKKNPDRHLTALIFWLSGPSFCVIWTSFNLAPGESRVGAYCWRNQGFSTVSSLPPNATAFEELNTVSADWDTRPQSLLIQQHLEILYINSTVSNALLGPEPHTY